MPCARKPKISGIAAGTQNIRPLGQGMGSTPMGHTQLPTGMTGGMGSIKGIHQIGGAGTVRGGRVDLPDAIRPPRTMGGLRGKLPNRIK